jgi:hypothetical protein
MEPVKPLISWSAKFIWVGAAFQFLLILIALIPPLSRYVNSWFLALDSASARQAISDIVLFWVVGAPIIGTILYMRLPLEQKAGREGMLLLFWWISLVVMILVALALGAGF